MRNTTSGRGRGFSLVEVAVATAIIGIAVTALMASLAAGTRSNRASQQITQAVFLAQELREWTSTLPFKDPDPGDANNAPGSDGTSPQSFVDDLDDLMGVTYSPPIDCTSAPAQRRNDLRGWSETFTLTWRDPNNLTHTVSSGGSEIIHVQVDIRYQNRSVLTSGWMVAKKE